MDLGARTNWLPSQVITELFLMSPEAALFFRRVWIA